MNTIVGKQSICFQRPPQIVSAASVVGKKESEGPLGTLFDALIFERSLAVAIG